MKPKVLFLQGINNQSQATVSIDRQGNFQLVLDGGTNTIGFLKADGWDIESLVLAPNQDQKEFEVKNPSIIFNDISDPDSHSIVLQKAKQVRKIFQNLPCINEPAAIEQSSREKVSRKLDGIQEIVVPKTIRIQPNRAHEITSSWESQFVGPVLLRKSGFHGGKGMILLRTREDLIELDRFALDGSAFYMTEFMDFKSTDGLYRKYRIVLIDGKVFLRHLLHLDHWNIHFPAYRAFVEKNPAINKQELIDHEVFDTQLKPSIADRCQVIADRMGLDYFGIDCGVLEDGRLVIFEVNANMNILINTRPKPNVSEVRIQNIRNALNELIRSKI